MEFDFHTDKLIRGAALRWYSQAVAKRPNQVIRFRDINKLLIPEIGKEIPLLAPQNGIWKPKGMSACLSLRSTVADCYQDVLDEHKILYKYRAHGGYGHSDNESLRFAMKHKLPMLYFHGIDEGVYVVEVVRAFMEEPDKSGVRLLVTGQTDMPSTAVADEAIVDGTAEMIRYGYTTGTFKRRTHQEEFRRRILTAYREQCAICRLKHTKLLDAAHIIPDSKGGRPETSNGLSLCRIHHGAYDSNILGIDPDYKVHINRAMLEEKDGPMLKHGFQEMDQQLIHFPRREADQPDRDRLDRRYSEFLNAT